MPFGRADGDHQLLGDLAVGFAGHDQVEHAHFLFAERFRQLGQRRRTGGAWWLDRIQKIVHVVGRDGAHFGQQVEQQCAFIQKEARIALRRGKAQGLPKPYQRRFIILAGMMVQRSQQRRFDHGLPASGCIGLFQQRLEDGRHRVHISGCQQHARQGQFFVLMRGGRATHLILGCPLRGCLALSHVQVKAGEMGGGEHGDARRPIRLADRCEFVNGGQCARRIALHNAQTGEMRQSQDDIIRQTALPGQRDAIG